MKPLQGILDFFLIRASRGPFHLKPKTQGPSHIHIPKGKLLLRCLWKDGLPLHLKTGNQLSSPGDLPKPGIELRSRTLQVNSLLSEPPGKPKNTGVDGLFLLQEIFPTQESNQGLLHCRWILYQLSYQGSP